MDDTRFEQMVREVHERALRLARVVLGDWDEARDAVQEAFVKAYRRRKGFRGDAAPSTWFFPILLNHCRDRLRRRKVRAFLTPRGRPGSRPEVQDPLETHPDPAPGPAEAAEQKAFHRALARAMQRLPRRQREVFQMKALGGLTLAETAAALGISVGAAKSHLFRATRALQRELAAWRHET